MKLTKKERLSRRHLRVRRKVSGSAERPRLCVRKTLKHLYASLHVDAGDQGSVTTACYTTATKSNAGKHSANITSATELGKVIGAELKAKGLDKVTFDRGGYRYHGVVKALADGVREAGIII